MYPSHNLEKFKETFNELQNIASQNLRAQDNEKALKALNKCADMLDVSIYSYLAGQEYSERC